MATRIAENWRGTDNLLVAQERRKVQETLTILQNAYLSGPWQLPPDELARQLKEQGIDEGLLNYLISQVGWDVIGGYGDDTTAERERTLNESVRLYKYSPLAQWAVWLWSNWGLGETLDVTPNDEGAVEVWDEFWEADRNARLFAADRIHELSHWLLVKGNRFMTFYASELDGEVTARLVAPEQVTAIVTNPDDASEPWFYRREYSPPSSAQKTLFYPDWETFFSDELEDRWEAVVEANSDISSDAERADRMNGGEEQLGGDAAPGTVVCMLHVAHNIKDESSLWGWPLLTCARPYIGAHKKFMEDRLSVASAVAMFVRRYQHAGGSRAQAALVDTIASNLSRTQLYDTNPPAAAGSSEVLNKALDVTDLPLKTGASDAKSDNEMFAWKALLGAGLFPTSAGLDTARWATALEMDKAQSMLFQGYQTFWGAQWRKMVKIVLLYKERYGGGSFKDKGAEVSVDSFSLADFPGVARTIGQIVRDALTPLVDNGTVPAEAAKDILAELWRILLQSLNVGKAADLTGEEAWEEPEEEEEPQPPPAAFQFQPGQLPVPQPEEPEVVEQIAAMIRRNARDGAVDWQTVAEWALEEKMEGANEHQDGDTS